jgi:hypothetical protein
MISILVDESYAYDYLSILHIKGRNKNCADLRLSIELCYDSIAGQVGQQLHNTIILSEEYENLLEANRETFEAVDKAKTDAVKASLIDALNYKRYLCKKDLQERFFECPQKEIKIGYV